MMKKVKSFNIGDKVFAKVKGYPAWPAKIVGANGKKYEVTFYGTMESGTIKVEDLFYYLKHKDQFYRNIKRKDYVEAFEQIEAEIKESGTDGNNGEDIDTLPVSEITEKRGRKRSRESINDEHQAKRINNRTTSADINESHEQEKSDETSSTQESDFKSSSQSVTRSGRVVKVKKFSDDEDEEGSKKSMRNRKSITSTEQEATDQESNFGKITKLDKNETIKENTIEETEENINQDECVKSAVEEIISTSSPIKEIENTVTETEEKSIAEVNILTIDYLETVIAYADYVKSKAGIYKKKAAEHREIEDNEVVVAKLPSNKLIGIKFKRNTPNRNNEYETAISESQEAKRIISIKDKLENGSITVDNEKDKLILDIQLNEEEIQEKSELKSLERKKAKLKFLKIESSLVESDVNIKSCLALDKADPKKAFEHMNLMMELDITPLMLKKHPFIVDVMKRLRRYIGNVKEWKLAGDSLETFEADAEKIRQKAEEVFTKFMSLFQVSDNASFWEIFHEEVEKFEEETKDMSESELFELCAEPDSRQAFFDRYENKSDVEKSDKTESKDEPLEKENSSNIANTEQITETQQNNIDTP